jgi:hypothetical protein
MKKLLSALVVASALAPATALAERTEPCPPGVVCLDGERLEVNVPRPRAFYVIDRSRLRHGGEEAQQNFTGDIVDSLERDPF